MSRRGDREVGVFWVGVALLCAMAGIVTGIFGVAHHSYDLVVASASCWCAAYLAMLIALPPRID